MPTLDRFRIPRQRVLTCLPITLVAIGLVVLPRLLGSSHGRNTELISLLAQLGFILTAVWLWLQSPRRLTSYLMAAGVFLLACLAIFPETHLPFAIGERERFVFYSWIVTICAATLASLLLRGLVTLAVC